MPAIERLDQKDRESRKSDVHERCGNQPLPTDVHQLIVAKPRQSPTQPEIQIQYNGHFREEDQKADRHIKIMMAADQPVDTGEIPAAEIQRSRYARDHHHSRILGHEKERPAKAGVFGVKTRNEFRLGFWQVEGRAIVFGNAAYQEDEKPDRLINDVPDRIRSLRTKNT